MSLRSKIEKELERTNGVLFGNKTMVGRGSYMGKNFLTKNSEKEDTDERGRLEMSFNKNNI